ncbi:hypothetical protein, partial [Enterobacter asburiae]
PAAAGIVNLRYKSCPEMAGQDHTTPAANMEVTATATNLSFILNVPYNFLWYFLSHFERFLNEADRQWHAIFKNLVVLFQ